MAEVGNLPQNLKSFELGEDLSRIKEISTWTRLRRSPGAMIGLVLIVILILMALSADFITPQGINEQSLRNGFIPPGSDYWLGTDEFGRDMYSRIVHGSRISLQVGIIATSISAVVGISLGLKE